MSHFTTLETQIVSSKHLIRALRDLGFSEVEVHREAQPLDGWTGSESAVVANVIIRRQHLGPVSNDIGFLQNRRGTFEAYISDMDKRKHGDEWLQQLTQRYAYHVAVDMLAEQDFATVDEHSRADGTLHLTVRRMR